MPYFSHIKLRKQFSRSKVRNSYSKLMGLDIGRKFIGVAISDADAKLAIPLKTFQIVPAGNALRGYDYAAHRQFYTKLRSLIVKTKTKGMVVGYPLLQNNEKSLHCKFIEGMLAHMMKEENIKTPITLIDEGYSTIDAKFELLLRSASEVPIETATSRKRLFDKFAARIILQRFLDFLHSSDEVIKPLEHYLPEIQREGILDGQSQAATLPEMINQR